MFGWIKHLLGSKESEEKINELVDHDYTNWDLECQLDDAYTIWDLESQHLNKNDAIILAKHIKLNKTMTSLDLRGNEIEDEGV